MYLSDCHITNFCGLADVKLDLHAPLVVLLGDNAAGKSSLLRALRVGIGAWLWEVPDAGVRAPSIGGAEMRRPIEKVGAETIRAWGGDAEIIVSGGFPGTDRWTYSGPPPFQSIVRRRKSKSARTQWKDSAPLRDEAKERIAKNDATLPLLAYFGATRQHEDSKRTAGKGPESRTMGYAKALDSTVDVNRLVSRWDRLNRQARLDTDAAEVLAALEEALSILMPGDDSVTYDPSLEQPLLVSSTRTDQCFDALSDGFRNVLEIGMDLALRSIQLNPVLGAAAVRQTPGVVLIDEVGQHLHPSWQTEVLRSLRDAFPAIQFIVSTHSPLVALHAGDKAKIYRASATLEGPRFERVEAVGNNVGSALRGPAFGPLVTWGPEWMQLAEKRASLLSGMEGELGPGQQERLDENAARMRELEQTEPSHAEDLVRPLVYEYFRTLKPKKSTQAVWSELKKRLKAEMDKQ